MIWPQHFKGFFLLATEWPQGPLAQFLLALNLAFLPPVGDRGPRRS